MDMAGVLITLALVENIQAPIAPGLVNLFAVKRPPEFKEVHSMETAIIGVVLVRSRVVANAAATSLYFFIKQQ